MIPTPNHSFEEIRQAAIELLSGRAKVNCCQDIYRYEFLENAVAELLARIDNPGVSPQKIFMGETPHLNYNDSSLCLEVFWNLFREGIITLGWNNANREYPFFKVSHFGKALLENQQVYFFHDVSSYETLVRQQVPAIDPTTLLYLKEAMQAFRSGCILSATVMLGVAAEHTFETLLDVVEANPTHAATYATALNQKNALTKLTKFWAILTPNLASMPYPIREDIHIQFPGIQNLIRIFRNESGHPTGKIIDREQCYVLLNMYIPYAKKVYQLIDHFK